MIAATINVNPRWFWRGPDALESGRFGEKH